MAVTSFRRPVTSFRRPLLHTCYTQDTQIFPTWQQKASCFAFIAVLVLLPFDIPVISQIPVIRFLGDEDWLHPVTETLVFAIAALGLNILSGVAGQVSLGHAFFMGVGACTAAYLGGNPTDVTWGHSLPVWVWLPLSGLSAAIIGMVVAPVAIRLRGLYLAVATLGLVFLGIHLSYTSWGRKIAGVPEQGRRAPSLDIRIWKDDRTLLNLEDDSRWLWFDVSDQQKRYLFFLMITVALAFISKNLIRTRTGRALQAIRDRDIAASVMGVHELRYKLVAFGLSSFYGGIAGALFVCLSGDTGRVLVQQFDLFMSVELIAILLIGGVGTTAGPLIGAFFVLLTPKFVEKSTQWLEKAEDSTFGFLSRAILTEGDDFGVINTSVQTPGWSLSVYDWNVVFYGVLIVVFLIVEPLGLVGIWTRIRNYWKQWPFSY